MPEIILTQIWFSIASVVSGIIFTVHVPTAVTEGSSVVMVPLFICLVILITVSLENMPALFACYLKAKVGRLKICLDYTPPPASFRSESIVCGHHVYKAVWSPYIGEKLLVECEVHNIQDDFAVAILKNSMIVGHMPREISRVWWHSLQKNAEEW